MPPERYALKKAVLDSACEREGRDPGTIRRSMMIFGAIMGPNAADLDRATRKAMADPRAGASSAERYRTEARARGALVGTTAEVVDYLGALSDLGVAEVQFDHADFDSDELPEYLASEVLPRAELL
jgi:alkanesulfonate monooxygenase SsuD/methylene tetrahydromethanopterin reductase-like flavin-dependent oxidoreductase (luciferase family)